MQRTDQAFLSYSTVDEEFALRLTADLKNAGLLIWMATLKDNGIEGSENWIDAITVALHDSRGLIAVISPSYFKSKYCRDELTTAYTNDLFIYPVLLHDLKGIPQKDIPFWFPQRQHFNFREWQDPARYLEQFNTLVERIKSDLDSIVVQVPNPEERYLNNLVSQLISPQTKGVLEFVELSLQAQNQPTRPRTYAYEWATGFSLLVEQNGQPTNSLANANQFVPIENFRDLMAAYPRFVLIGDPGAGKTTTMRKLAYDAARSRLENKELAPLPLMVSLPSWTEQNFLDFLKLQWESLTIPLEDVMQLLERGNAVLFLDGLNEMGANKEDKVKELRAWLASPQSPQRVIVTCRVRDYTDDLRLDLPLILVEEMSEDQIRQFVGNYLTADASGTFLDRILPNIDDEHWLPDDAKQRITERSLFQLARNPYLLAALIYIFVNSPENDLPRNFGTLFRRLTAALWERERIRQTEGWIPFEKMETQFAALAFAMIDKDKPTIVELKYGKKFVRNENLLKAGHSATLVEVRDDELRFYHQLLQEYFAAVHLDKIGLKRRLSSPRLTYGGQISSKWSQVIIALCGITASPSERMLEIVKVDTLLAALCIASGVSITEGTKQEIIPLLFAPSIDMFVIRDTFNVLTEVREPLIIPYLINLLAHHSYRVFIPAANALQRLGEATLYPLLESLDHEDSRIRVKAATILGRIGNPQAVPKLIKKLSDQEGDGWGKPTYTCDEAARALKRIGTSEALKAVENWQNEKMQTLLTNGRKTDLRTIWSIQELLQEPHDELYESLLRRFDTNLILEIGEIQSWQSLEILRLLRDPVAVSALEKYLGDDYYRSTARRILEEMGTPEALAAIQRSEAAG